MKIARLALIFSSALLVSPWPAAAQELDTLAPPTVRLAKAVDGVVQFRELPSSTASGSILDAISDQELRKPLASMRVETRSDHGRGEVMVCTPDGRKIFEDAGCTAPIDLGPGELGNGAACSFQLDLGTVCAAAAAP